MHYASESDWANTGHVAYPPSTQELSRHDRDCGYGYATSVLFPSVVQDRGYQSLSVDEEHAHLVLAPTLAQEKGLSILRQ